MGKLIYIHTSKKLSGVGGGLEEVNGGENGLYVIFSTIKLYFKKLSE